MREGEREGGRKEGGKERRNNGIVNECTGQ